MTALEPGGADPSRRAVFEGLAALTRSRLATSHAVISSDALERPCWGGADDRAVPAELTAALAELVTGPVARTGRPVQLAGPANAAPFAAAAAEPVFDADGQLVGILSVLDQQPRNWTPGELATLRGLADQVGAELGLDQTLSQLRLATAKLGLLAEANHRLADTLNVEKTVGELARLVVPVLGDWCMVSAVDDDGRLQDLGWWHGTEDGRSLVHEFISDRLAVLSQDSPTYRVFREGKPFVLPAGALAAGLRTLSTPRSQAVWQRLAPESYAVFPMVAGPRINGVLCIVRGSDRPPMSDFALEVAEGIASRAGLALENARLFQSQRLLNDKLSQANSRLLASSRHDRVVSRALQDAMLPSVSAGTGDLQVCARYRTADGEDQVGGDFYDAINARSGGTTVVIGDVSGHDIAAAAVMGRITPVLRSFVWDRPDESPAELLERLDRAMTALDVAKLTTTALFHLDQPVGGDYLAGRRSEWSNAGHLPPLLITADGASFLGQQPDPPLGITARAARRDFQLLLPAGSTLLLYTDGLVESRQRDLDAGLQQLRAFVSEQAALPLAELLDATLQEMVPGEFGDDVALVGVRLRG
ncbi:MAG TPA: GAF domain-containing SpoIIE family protein phosphatase [Jatrophihabitans sp.]|nr:GAF domain-containing SpoIIE family protein phosphatase [Jatrophihabitans sp.]